MSTKMDTKKLLVSFVAIVTALFLVATVAAADITSSAEIEVNDIDVAENPSVIAGDKVEVEITFTALENASDVRVKAEIEGDKIDVDAMSKPFDVEAGHTYKKTLMLEVPFELKDEVSEDVTLNVKIWNGDYKSEFENIDVRVQRPSYNPVIKSVTVSQSVDAGETFPVDLVLKNLGYNDLDDVYVTVGITELGVQKTAYFGDLVPIEENNCNVHDDDCDDTVSGRIYLEVPFGVDAGIYTLSVEVTNDDSTFNAVKPLIVENDVSQNVIVTNTHRSVNVGEDAEYTLLVVNPTNSLKVYTVIPESNSGISSVADNAVIAVPAGSSKTVTVSASADEAGEYTFNVNVLAGSKVVETVALNLNAEAKTNSSPIVVLTVVLAIIFLVLLVVLIVLLGKKPQKSEEFGESYY